MSSPGIAEPPEQQILSDEWSRSSRESSLSIALYIVGTPAKIVTWSRSMISSALAGSKRGMNVSVAPESAQVFMQHVWPNEWNSGSAPSTMSSTSVPNTASIASAFLNMLSWVSSAPLGWPVVPDVEDHRGVGAVALDDLARRLGVAEQLLELAGLDDDDLAARLLGALLGRLEEVVPREDPLGLGVLEVELDLAALQEHVHRHDGAARAQDAVVSDREVGDVRRRGARRSTGFSWTASANTWPSARTLPTRCFRRASCPMP